MSFEKEKENTQKEIYPQSAISQSRKPVKRVERLHHRILNWTMLIFLSAILIFLIFAVVRHIYHHYIGNFQHHQHQHHHHR